MEVLTQRQHRLLAFVDACNRSGYRPTRQQVLKWMASPEPRIARTLYSDMMASIGAQMLQSLQVKDSGEDDIAHAERLEWVSREPIAVTDLGRALLASADRAEVPESAVDVVVLDREDPLAYPRLISLMAPLAEATLVDPYLRIEQFHDVVQETGVDRVLISKRYKDSPEVRAAISVYLGSGSLSRQVEVRATGDPDVHDRFVVSASGVFMIGTSLNSVSAGVASTLWIQLPQAAASAQRERVQLWWQDADPVAIPTRDQADPPETSD